MDFPTFLGVTYYFHVDSGSHGWTRIIEGSLKSKTKDILLVEGTQYGEDSSHRREFFIPVSRIKLIEQKEL